MIRCGRRIDAIVTPLHHNGRGRDIRLRRKARLGRIVLRVAWDNAKAMAIGMDDDIHEIRVFK
jgi:hypothetical protein